VNHGSAVTNDTLLLIAFVISLDGGQKMTIR
jgi:hypothetical protein